MFEQTSRQGELKSRVVKIGILIACLGWISCASSKIALKPATDCVCGSKDSGVDVRVRNTGTRPFSSFSIKIKGHSYSFEGLNPGQTSCYQNLPFVWSINEYIVWYERKSGSMKGAMSRPYDYIGERKYDTGHLTILVPSYGVKDERTLQIKVKPDKYYQM